MVNLRKTRSQNSLRPESRRALARTALVIMVSLLAQSSTIASGDATTGHFSQRQIMSYIQTVTSELQLSKNWNSSFGSVASGTLYCNSSLLGEGVRAGNHGLYTWFTCSAMHKLDVNAASHTALTCTGFSSPVWIQPGLNTISYQAISSGSEFAAFRSSAPAQIQAALDETYNQVNKKENRTIIGRAITGNTESSKATPTTVCQ